MKTIFVSKRIRYVLCICFSAEKDIFSFFTRLLRISNDVHIFISNLNSFYEQKVSLGMFYPYSKFVISFLDFFS